MATSLQAQLAKVAASSTNPLDLKAQRIAHAKSLLFEPREAGSQDFDGLYLMCRDGFNDICRLDARFTRFSRNIFSEQSKHQDRTQMTATQNKELDVILEEFLSLLGGYLLLIPAAKAVEWLIRRFRIHELNTLSTVLTFLPYYAEPIFGSLLHITPNELPPTLRFLIPYRSSRQNPSRQAIVQEATRNTQLFNSLNQYTISSCKRNDQNSRLAIFWASIITEALTGQLEVAATGRMEARRQKEEDVMIRVVPTLNEGLTMKNSGLRDGCYALLAILSSKLQLPESTVLSIMEAVLQGRRKQLAENDLVCLAILSQSLTRPQLPKKVFKGLLQTNDLVTKLAKLTRAYDIDRLLLALLHTIVDRADKLDNKESFALYEKILSMRLLSASNTKSALKLLKDTTDSVDPEDSSQLEIKNQLNSLTLRLATSDNLEQEGQGLLPESDAKAKNGREEDTGSGDSAMGGSEAEAQPYVMSESDDHFKARLESLPDYTAQTSFLHSQTVAALAPLTDACIYAGSSIERWMQLQTTTTKDDGSVFLTLLVRLWCGSFAVSVRRQALIFTKVVVKSLVHDRLVDMQFLLPYILVGLADHQKSVRKASSELVILINELYQATSSKMAIWGEKAMPYPEKAELVGGLFVATDDAAAFTDILVQNLEECRLDPSYAGTMLQASLSEGRVKTGGRLKTFNEHAKESLLEVIAAHISLTPCMTAQFKLLQLLHGVSKVKSKSKSNLLLPLLHSLTLMDLDEIETKCKSENLTMKAYIGEVINTVSGNSKSGLKLLNKIIEGKMVVPNLLIREIATDHIRKIWSSMKAERQAQAATVLYAVVWGSGSGPETANLTEFAAEVLRSVSLNVDALCQFIDMLPDLIDDRQTGSGPAKRRRTDKGRADGHQPRVAEATVQSLQQWAFVLELIEGAENHGDFVLINKLCVLLKDVYACMNELGGQVNYVVSLLLEACNATVKDIAQNRAQIDPNVIPVEDVIDIFQTNQNSQIQRAALLFISTLAQAFPEVIIHHIMPVFTKMGQSVLLHADEYSVRISDLAIQSIVPPLLQSFGQQQGHSNEGVVRLLLSFVASFEHIPPERRPPLYKSLVQQIGSTKSLHLLLLLFVDRFGRNRAIEDFIIELFASYDAIDQLTAVSGSLKLAANALSDYPRPFTIKVLRATEKKAQAATVLQVVNLASRLVQDRRLLRQTTLGLDSDGDKLRPLYSGLSEDVLNLTSLAGSYKKLSIACEELQDATSHLFPVHESIDGMTRLLLASTDDEMSRQALKAIEQRARSVRTGDLAAQGACLRLLPVIKGLLQSRNDDWLLQTCVSCFDSIIERFGKKDSEASLEVLAALASAKFLSSENAQTVEMSILCIATAAQMLGEAIIPLLPQIVPLVIESMSVGLETASSRSGLNAAFTLFAAILDSTPWVLSRTDVESLLRLSAQAASSGLRTDDLWNSRTSAIELLARRIDVRECLLAVSVTWKDAVTAGMNKSAGSTSRNEPILQHLHIVRTIVNASSKSIVSRHSRLLMEFYQQVFELPAQSVTGQLPTGSRGGYREDNIEEVVESAADDIVAMVYKLNDASFRPLYSSLLEWANGGGSKAGKVLRNPRSYALYIFLGRFFRTLKSIVTSYAGMIVDDAAELLMQKPGDGVQSSIEKYYGHSVWCRVLESLRQAFDNDADEYFQTPTRFGPLCAALVAQIAELPSHAKRVPIPLEDEDAQEVLEEHLLPTIVSLATAADAAENAKTLNKGILKEMRNQKAVVRATAIRCQQLLVEKLGDEWLANLPEMLPVIGEVLEDEDEEVVVAEARKWVSAIEAVLGESLEGMLQ